MTEFEIIKKALARVRADVEIYDFPTSKSIHIPVDTLLDPNAELELEFDGEGKLINTFVLLSSIFLSLNPLFHLGIPALFL